MSQRNLNIHGRRYLSPFEQFARGLHAAQVEFNETIDELRAFIEVMARKTNSLDMDENGKFYIVAAGTIDEIIPALEAQLKKLERIKKQKDTL